MNGPSLLAGASLPGTALFQARSQIDNAAAPRVPTTGTSEEVRRAAEDFEAFYLTQALSTMFAGIETDPLFGGGPGEGVFRAFLTQEYGKILARAGGVGIADSVAREIIKLQEAR
jgi:Rod binding domain-containing protein